MHAYTIYNIHTHWYVQLTQNLSKKKETTTNHVDITNIVDNNYNLYNLAYGFVVLRQGESTGCEWYTHIIHWIYRANHLDAVKHLIRMFEVLLNSISFQACDDQNGHFICWPPGTNFHVNHYFVVVFRKIN